MKKTILFSLILLASCQEYKSPETIKLEMELDSIHNEVTKTKIELGDSLSSYINKYGKRGY